MEAEISTSTLDFNKIWLLFQETNRKFEETDRKFQETSLLLKNESLALDQKIDKISRAVGNLGSNNAAWDEKMDRINDVVENLGSNNAEWERKMDRIGIVVGNMGNNNADVAEDFFFNGLAQSLKVANLTFDFIDRNTTRRKNRIQGEYDIILYNADKVFVIEVKYKLHPDDVARFVEKKLPIFRTLYSEYNHCRLYAGVASFAIPDDARNLAQQAGLFILQQSGENILVANSNDFNTASF